MKIRIRSTGILMILSLLLTFSIAQAQPAGASARSASPAPAPRAAPRLSARQNLALQAKGKAAQLKREAHGIDAAVASTQTKLALAMQGERALLDRGRSSRTATADRANLQNELQDLRVQQTRVHNALSDAFKAVQASRRESWQAASAHLQASDRSRAGTVTPRARTVTYSALPPSQANSLAAASGMRLGSVRPR